MVDKVMRERARALAAEGNLAYVVLPEEDDRGRPLLFLAGVRDRSEAEFDRVEATRAALVAMIQLAIRRIEAGVSVLLSIASEDGVEFRSPLAEKWADRLGRHKAALQMAEAWAADLVDGPHDAGASGLGACWGRGIRATLHELKEAEKWLAGARWKGREAQWGIGHDDWRLALLEEASLGVPPGEESA
jgi:hypothetical protein